MPTARGLRATNDGAVGQDSLNRDDAGLGYENPRSQLIKPACACCCPAVRGRPSLPNDNPDVIVFTVNAIAPSVDFRITTRLGCVTDRRIWTPEARRAPASYQAQIVNDTMSGIRRRYKAESRRRMNAFTFTASTCAPNTGALISGPSALLELDPARPGLCRLAHGTLLLGRRPRSRCGGPGRDRTFDRGIMSPLLCH